MMVSPIIKQLCKAESTPIKATVTNVLTYASGELDLDAFMCHLLPISDSDRNLQ
jgi:hypothetical protein